MKDISLMTPKDYIHIAIRRKWFIIIPFILIGLGSVGLSLKLPKIYRSNTLILVQPQRIPSEYVKSTVTSPVEERLQTIREQVLSRTRLEEIITKFNLYSDLRDKLPPDEIVERMRKAITIRVKQRDAFEIYFEDKNPKLAADVANALTEQFINANITVREEQARETSKFLEEMLNQREQELRKKEALLLEFTNKYMGQLPEDTEVNLKVLDQLQLQRQNNTIALKNAQDRKAIIEKKLQDYKEAEMLPLESKTTSVENELKNAKLELAELLSRYKEKHPDVVSKKKEIAEIEKKLNELIKENNSEIKSGVNPQYQELENKLEMVNREIANLMELDVKIQEKINEYQTKIDNTPAIGAQFANLKRDYDEIKRHYDELLRKKLDADLSQKLESRQKGEQFIRLDSAHVPQKPYKPDCKKIILMGFILGLGVGFGIAFFIEYMNNTFIDLDDVKLSLEIPALIAIPKINPKIKKIENRYKGRAVYV